MGLFSTPEPRDVSKAPEVKAAAKKANESVRHVHNLRRAGATKEEIEAAQIEASHAVKNVKRTTDFYRR